MRGCSSKKYRSDAMMISFHLVQTFTSLKVDRNQCMQNENCYI
jgi:hypothetical protein